MKKLLFTTFFITFFSTSLSFAKTAGSYASIDLLRSSTNHKYARNNVVSSNYSKFSDSSIGIGVNYKYAFNVDRIFFAPEIFFEKIGIDAIDQDNDRVSINYRSGAKFNIGYDLNEKFGIYFTSGLSSVNYEVDWKSINRKKSGFEFAYLYGAGISYHLLDNITLGLEYNIQSNKLRTPSTGTNSINNAKTDLGVAKFSVAYHF